MQIKSRVTKEERSLIEEKMKQVPTSNMEAYLRKNGDRRIYHSGRLQRYKENDGRASTNWGQYQPKRREN